MSCMFLAAGVGGFILPVLIDWFRRGRRMLPRPTSLPFLLPVFLILFGVPLTSTFRYETWLANEPLRLLAAVGMGLLLPAAHQAFFAGTNPRRWGFRIGLIGGGGLFFWRVLNLYAASRQGEGWNGFPPGLWTVFIIHTASALALGLALAATLPLDAEEPAADYPSYFKPMEPQRRRRIVFLLFGAELVLIFMNGLLQAGIFPVVDPRWSPVSALVPFMFLLFCPLFGHLLDRSPDRALPAILRGWSWLFILAPSLAVLGSNTLLYGILHAACTLGQVVLLMVFVASLGGLATSAAGAGAMAGLAYGVRILSVYWNWLLEFVPDQAPGMLVAGATLLAFLYHHLVTRLAAIHAADMAPAEDAPAPTPSDDIERFLDRGSLTEREREIAARVLAGHSSRAISEDLGISQNTVNFHIKKVLDKYGVASRKAFCALLVMGKYSKTS